MEADNGPIRRRINSFTVKLEPFVNVLTDEEAIIVRNTIESIIQSYFFEVQPWATTVNSENSNDIGDDITAGNNNDATATTTTTTTTAAAGSVTYVGLAQILENRQTEDNQGVQLTMNGLIYFAEGSQDIPDETELLETMERQALSPEAVVEALKADFPSLQLVTVIETATAVAGDDKDNTAITNTPADTTTSTTTTTNSVPTLSPIVEIKSTTTATTTSAPSPSPSLVVVLDKTSVQEVPVTEGSSSSAIVSSVEQQQDTIIDGDNGSLNIAAFAGGLATGFVVLFAILGLFIIRTKRRSSSSSKKNDSNDGQYLVNINSKDLFGSTSQEDWQLNSNSPTKTPRSNSKEVEDLQKSISQQMDDLEKAISLEEQQRSPSEVSKTRKSRQQLENDTSNKDISGASTSISYMSSFFTKLNPMQKQQQQQQEEVRSVSTNGGDNDGGGGGDYTTSNNNNNNDGTADGESTLSDFDDTVSIQPHIVTLESLESFEEQHKMTRQVCVVQKEMLESSFERINNVGASCAGSSNLSYSSSSLDSSKGKSRGNSNNNNNPSIPQKLVFDKNRHKELEEEKEEQRIRYSMMPNPYFRRTYPGAAPGATIEDRSLPCALTPTDTTAATLARRTTSPGSETGLGMIPKLSAPAWWSSSNEKSSLDNNRSPSSRSRSSRSSGSRRKSRGSSISKDRRSSGSNKSSNAAATATAAYSDDDLAYSGDEENTFGVPSSDGWDPADAELSSIGDAPDQDEINMILFHPKGTGGNNNERSVPQSLLNNTSNTTAKGSFKILKQKSKSPTQKQAGAPEYWNGDNSVSSEESNVLKFDSSVSMEI
jgi:hypothetical protein